MVPFFPFQFISTFISLLNLDGTIQGKKVCGGYSETNSETLRCKSKIIECMMSLSFQKDNQQDYDITCFSYSKHLATILEERETVRGMHIV